MNVINPSDVPSRQADPAYFTGTVHLRRMVETEAPADVKILRVEFPAGARTNWHTHSGVQVLVVVEGRCRFQHQGGPVQEAGAGEVVRIEPGERHWHGATPDAPMVHLAINIATDTNWLEPVTDEQYREGA